MQGIAVGLQALNAQGLVQHLAACGDQFLLRGPVLQLLAVQRISMRGVGLAGSQCLCQGAQFCCLRTQCGRQLQAGLPLRVLGVCCLPLAAQIGQRGIWAKLLQVLCSRVLLLGVLRLGGLQGLVRLLQLGRQCVDALLALRRLALQLLQLGVLLMQLGVGVLPLLQLRAPACQLGAQLCMGGMLFQVLLVLRLLCLQVLQLGVLLCILCRGLLRSILRQNGFLSLLVALKQLLFL